MENPMTIGIPRALWYFLHPGLWEDFFTALGLSVVISQTTSRTTVERAGMISESEHCLPVKIHDAHLDQLADRVDWLFVPRIFSSLAGHIACPKLGALTDCAIAQFGDRTSIVAVDLNETRRPLRKSMVKLGRQLGFGRGRTATATDWALRELTRRGRLGARTFATPAGPGKVLLLGHPYNLEDGYLSRPVIAKLRELGVDCRLISEQSCAGIDDGPLKWDTCSLMYDAIVRLRLAEWAGVVQLSSFNCGCDSVAMEIFQPLLKSRGIPYLRLVLDEYNGRAGLDTRLEAFVDSIGW